MEVVHKVPRPDRPPLYPDMLENATPILKPPRAESLIPFPDEAPKKSVEKPQEPPAKKSMVEKSDGKVSPSATKKTKPMVDKPDVPPSKKPKVDKPDDAVPTAKKSKFEKPDVPLEPPPKKSKVEKPDDAVPPTKKETECPEDGDLQVVQLPIQTEITGRSMANTLAIYFCGTCAYPNKHRYILLSNGEAIVMVPICQKCNKLNMTLSTTIRKFDKCGKEEGTK